MLRDAVLENTVRFLFQNAERWQVGWWPVLLIKRCQVEAFMFSKGFVCYDLTEVSKSYAFNILTLTFAVRNKCCSSRSLFFASNCSLSSSSRRSFGLVIRHADKVKLVTYLNEQVYRHP
jgi:hypothetical protein